MFGIVSVLILGFCGILETPVNDSDCKIKEILAIRGPNSFVCRAADGSRFGPARLFVTIRGIDAPESVSPQSLAFLDSILNNAQTIRLSNIEMASFFRLTCSVEVDGKDLSQILVSKGVAQFHQSESLPVPSVSVPDSLGRSAVSIHACPPRSSPARNVRLTDWKSLLDQTVDLSRIMPDTPFGNALEQIRTSIQPPLAMMINWNDLRQNAFIEPSSPVGLDGLKRIDIGTALELICNAVDGGKGRVSFTQRGKVVVVASRESLGDPKTLRIIDISELSAPKSTGYGMSPMFGGYGSSTGSGYGMAGSIGNQIGGMIPNLNSGLSR